MPDVLTGAPSEVQQGGEGNASVAYTPKRRGWRPFRPKPFTGAWPESEFYTTITERGTLIDVHSVRSEIVDGGSIVVGIDVDRRACLVGLLTGRLNIEMTAHLWALAKYRPNNVPEANLKPSDDAVVISEST